MFTGIITEIGTVEKSSSRGGCLRFRISAPRSAPELNISDSISINGACHTVVWKKGKSFEVESVEETLKKTALGSLKSGSRVNLEMPMKASGRFDGHIVLGHVDAVGSVVKIGRRESSSMFTFEIPTMFCKYVVPVGSIAVDGVSLTVAEIDGNCFTVSIIPHTMQQTIFQSYKKGTKVNLEFDIVGKYIERMIDGEQARKVAGKRLDKKRLLELGY
jgi:riboflavin synthase